MPAPHQHSPAAAGQALLNYCVTLRRQLRADLPKPADHDEAGWAIYVESLVRIQRMDYNELRLAAAQSKQLF